MRIAIIGGGVYGSAIAYFLQRYGADDVVVFEKNDIGGISTSRSAGIVRHHYSDENHIRIVKRSREILEDLDTHIGRDGDFRQNGYLAVAGPENEESFREIVRIQKKIGLDVDLLEPTDIEKYHPAISSEGLVVGAIEHKAGFADPYQVAVGFLNKARELGTEVHPQTSVVDLETETGDVKAVQTEDDRYEVDYVVNAAGPYGANIASMVGVEMPITWHGALVVVLTASEPYGPDLPTLSFIDDGLYTKPEQGGEFIAGGFAHNPIEEPSQGSGQVTSEHLMSLFDIIEERLPGYADAQVMNTWTGIITDTPDAQQIMGVPAGVDNFYIAVGGNGHGFKEAPGFAESIAQEILGGEPEHDLSPYRLERYQEGDEFVGRYEDDWLG